MGTAAETLHEHVEFTPGVADGKSCIAGCRIPVQNDIVWHKRLSRSADEIADEYELSPAEVYVPLAYCFGHRDEVDRSTRQGNTFADTFCERTTSKMRQRLALPGPLN